jgi:hypothetical protein
MVPKYRVENVKYLSFKVFIRFQKFQNTRPLNVKNVEYAACWFFQLKIYSKLMKHWSQAIDKTLKHLQDSKTFERLKKLFI